MDCWQLGVVEDGDGGIHLGAVVAASDAGQSRFVDLLAPVGAAQLRVPDLDRLVTIVRGEQLSSFRRLVEQCIDNVQLKNRLLELASVCDWQSR